MAKPLVGVEVEGLASFRRAMRAAGPDARKALTRELKGVSEFVRDMAVHEAHAKGLDDSGDLIAGLKAGVRGTTGYVRDTAHHRGYGYPARIEYEDGGKRAFLRPVVEEARAAIEARLWKAVENVIDEVNRGGL